MTNNLSGDLEICNNKKMPMILSTPMCSNQRLYHSIQLKSLFKKKLHTATKEYVILF